MLQAVGHALMRPLIYRNLVGHSEAVAYAAVRQRNPLIKTKNTGSWRFRLDNKSDVLETPAEASRNFLQGQFYERIELVGIHRFSHIVERDGWDAAQ